MDPTILLDEYDRLSKLGGHAGGTAALIFLLVRLYRVPGLQAFLRPSMRWENLPLWVRYTALLGLAAAGGVILSLGTGHSWADALRAGLSGLLTAVAADKLTTTPAVQAVLAPVKKPDDPPSLPPPAQPAPTALPPTTPPTP